MRPKIRCEIFWEVNGAKVSVVYPMDQSIFSTISCVAGRGVPGLYAPEFLRTGRDHPVAMDLTAVINDLTVAI
jgi:hypothetical protein